MKKLVLCVISVAVLSIGMVGCSDPGGQNPNKIEAPSALSL